MKKSFISLFSGVWMHLVFAATRNVTVYPGNVIQSQITIYNHLVDFRAATKLCEQRGGDFFSYSDLMKTRLYTYMKAVYTRTTGGRHLGNPGIWIGYLRKRLSADWLNPTDCSKVFDDITAADINNQDLGEDQCAYINITTENQPWQNIYATSCFSELLYPCYRKGRSYKRDPEHSYTLYENMKISEHGPTSSIENVTYSECLEMLFANFSSYIMEYRAYSVLPRSGGTGGCDLYSSLSASELPATMLIEDGTYDSKVVVKISTKVAVSDEHISINSSIGELPCIEEVENKTDSNHFTQQTSETQYVYSSTNTGGYSSINTWQNDSSSALQSTDFDINTMRVSKESTLTTAKEYLMSTHGSDGSLPVTTSPRIICLLYKPKLDIEDLKLHRKNLSSYLRTKICAPDRRVSSKYIGSVALGFLVICCLVLVISDLHTYFCFKTIEISKRRRKYVTK